MNNCITTRAIIMGIIMYDQNLSCRNLIWWAYHLQLWDRPSAGLHSGRYSEWLGNMGDASLFHQSISINQWERWTLREKNNKSTEISGTNKLYKWRCCKKTQVSRSLSNSRLSVGSPHPTGVQNIFSTVHPNGWLRNITQYGKERNHLYSTSR